MDTTSKKSKVKKFALVCDFIRGSTRYFVAGILFSLGVTLLDMLTPQIISFTVDSVIGDKQPASASIAEALASLFGGVDFLKSNIWALSVMVIIIAVFSVICRYFNRLMNTCGAENLVLTMRTKLYDHIERLPFEWHMKNQTGDIIQRCTSDVDMVKRFLSEQLTSVFRIAILLVLSVSLMLSMNAVLALIAIAFIPLIVSFSFIFHSKIGKGFTKCDENEGKLSAIAQENLTGVRVVRAFGRESYEKERFAEQNSVYTGYWLKLCRLLSGFWAVSDLISGLQVMLIVTLGAVMCVRGNMSAGNYIAFISYNAMLIWPVRMLGRMISEMSKAGVSLGRIGEIMEYPIESDSADALTPDMSGDISFEHVCFSYVNGGNGEGNVKILDDISFTVKAGTTVGILGGTGSGKSTLMYLMNRLYPLGEGGGRITVSGVDINNIKSSWLRSSIGMVLQEPFLFSRTLMENIGITRNDITTEEIREASRIACLDETVESFKNGYDTFVGERGVTLSGGQKQRAAIARILTQKTPILVFDDSLSAVDTETDSKIRAALKHSLSNSTVFLISHRITTLMHADKIIVLDRGKIAQSGTHDELIAEEGIYKRIYTVQSRDPDSEVV